MKEIMSKDNYIKVVYRSNPIGKEEIILQLTTFDLEKFEKDEELKKIPEKTKAIYKSVEKKDLLNPDYISDELNKIVNDTYRKEIENLKAEVEFLRQTKIVPMEFSGEKSAKNINNADDVHCNIVYGNITNCDNIYCNEIKGNIINCDKIVYK